MIVLNKMISVTVAQEFLKLVFIVGDRRKMELTLELPASSLRSIFII